MTALTEKQLARREKLLAAITQEIQPVKAPLQYKLALLLATFVMVLLPVIYVGIACGFAYVVYYHMIHSIGIFDQFRGRGMIMAVILYLGPLIAGVIAVLFMFKPLFSRAGEKDKPTSLTRNEEPILFDFVDKLCDTVHAPRPKRIDVDCQVNASASFRRGWLSMLLGNDLVLTIGLPLVAGMSARELGGILAHEFGHFAQGGGMRLTYVVRTISMWFTRVVYERDSWDESLERWSTEVDIRIGIIFYLARGCVWLTRRILWVLMMIGHGVSGLLLRQMEFDADRHEVRFSGSDTIEPTTRRLHELMYAHNMSFNDLALAYREGRLADDLTRLVSLNADELPDEVEELIDKQISEGSTGWLDTHPCDRERIVSGEKENAPGVFQLKAPASAFFVNLSGVSKRATANYYRMVLGQEFRHDQLQSTDEVVERRQAQKRASEAMDAFSQDGLIPLQAFPLPSDGVPELELAKSHVEALKSLRQQILDMSPKQKVAVKQIDKADDGLSECSRASLLVDADFKIPSGTFSRNLSSTANIHGASQSFNSDWSRAEEQYSEFVSLVSKRLWTCIGLLNDSQIQAKLEGAEDWLREANTSLLPALRVVKKNRKSIMDFRSDSERLNTCLTMLQNGAESEGLIRETRKSLKDCRNSVRSIRNDLGVTLYPFEHQKADMTIAKFLCPKIPAEDDFEQTIDAVSTLLENYFSLYHRLLGRLCEIATAVEKKLGLEPLPQPEKEDEPEE